MQESNGINTSVSVQDNAIVRFFRDLVITVLVVVSFTTLIIVLAGAPPLAAYYHIFKGSLGSWVKLGHVIRVWIPLTLCTCGLLYTFRIGLWNIGVEGQVIMGAIFCTSVLRFGMDGRMGNFFLSPLLLLALQVEPSGH